MIAFRLRVLTSMTVLAMAMAGCGGSATESGTRVDSSAAATTGVPSFLGAEPAQRYTMPDITLEDTSGRPFNLVTDTTDPITLVFFGYTHCPDICPLVLSDLTLAVEQLPDEVAAQTQVVFVTTDPDRDTPSVIRSYLDRFDDRFVGLTGPIDQIVAAAGAMQVAIEGRKRLPSGGYDVGHGAQVVGFAHDQAPVVWTEGTPVGDVVSDIIELAGP